MSKTACEEILDRTKAPEIKPMGALELPLPKVEILDNGTVLHLLNGGTQEINQLSIVWPGGIAEARTPAIAKLAGNLLREGADGLSGSQLSEELDYRGAIVRSDCSEHYSVLMISSVNSLSDGVFPIVSKMVSKPDFPDHAMEVYREKEVQTLRLMQSKVAYLTQKAISPLIMGADNPLAKEETIEDIMNISRHDLVDFHRRVYRSGQCQAFLAGRIDEKIYAEAKALLLSLPEGQPDVKLNIRPYAAQSPQKVFVPKAAALQNSVRMAFPAPERAHPDYIPLRFAVMALGGYFGSRLMKNIREDKGYTYGIQAYLLGTIDGSYVSISAQTDPKYVDLVIQEVKKELELLATEPILDDEKKRLSQHIEAALLETLDSSLSVMEHYKSRLIVGLPDGYFKRQVELARSFDSKMIMEMARKYLIPDQMRIAVSGADSSQD